MEKFIEAIESKVLEDDNLINEKEIEVATKILRELEGLPVIRATSILKFCVKATQYSRVNSFDK